MSTASFSLATIHGRFEAQAARMPQAVAVTCGDRSLTYRELNARANQLAHRLRALSVGPEVLVGICLERSIEAVVAILGVLKAGGAYLPLDPAYPPQRLAFILAEAAIGVLITEHASLRDLPPGRAAELRGRRAAVVCLDADRHEIARLSAANPKCGTGSEQLAYVIYTSGSTGAPKGVLVSHHNVVRLFTATAHWFDFGPADVWTLFHSLAFDLSVWEMWGALLHGGRLVVVPYLVSRSPAAFYELVARERVSVLNQTPSAFRQLVWAESAAGGEHDLRLRHVILGGEALALPTLKPWFERHGDVEPRVVNMYGITEATVHVTFRPITAADLATAPGSVIGVPIPDLQLYLLDEDLRPVPTGTDGELFVAGAGLARGYLNRPELTAERFLPSPFPGTPGGRLYRTGDLARRHPDGELEFRGRCDDQVKIRGFRIEPGEIRYTLSRHPLLCDCAVTASEDGAGTRRLIAYVVVRPGRRLSVGELRAFLAERLPEHMVPAVFVFLETLPLTAHGKVATSALPSPGHARPELAEPFVAPRTGGERTLARIWSEVLEVQRVGIDDGFFELGGDSISAIQVLARAEQQGLGFTLDQLFTAKTIRKLSEATEQHVEGATRAVRRGPFDLMGGEDRGRLPPGLEDAYPLVQLQGGMFYHNERFPASAAYNNVSAFRVEFPFDRAALQGAVDRLVMRHAPLRTSFDLGTFSQPLQLVHGSVAVPLLVRDSRHLTAEEQARELVELIEKEKRRPFDRTVAPLLRLGVQRCSDREFRFIVCFHHAVLDGWSQAALVTAILTDFRAAVRGSAVPAPAPQVHYREYVALELEAVASDSCRRYWSARVRDADIPPLPRWPELYRPGGSDQVRSREIPVPAQLLDRLRALAQAAGVPLKSVLLAAHQRVMSVLLATRNVTSGLVTNGRPEELGGDRMIGLFLNVVPFRLGLPGGTWLDLVRETFAAELALIPFRRFPLAESVRLAGGRQLFESAFNFVHFHVYRELEDHKDMGFQPDRYFEANSIVLITTFTMDPSSARLQFQIDFDPAELCPAQIEQILGYYLAMLGAMAEDPSARYEAHSPLAPEERRRMLVEWNATRREYPRTVCLHELVEAQVSRTPDAVAVLAGTHAMTYAELDGRADRLAQRLVALGVGPEVLVGLCMTRCAEMLVAMLGILKAGGAYLALDPGHPKARLALMLEDSRAPVLLTQTALRGALPRCGARTLWIDEPDTSPPPRPPMRRARPDDGAGPGNLAYVIYTSGSTGTPKGVAIEHRSAVAFIHWALQTFTRVELAGVLASTSLCFDLSVFEAFATLAAGGTVILAENVLQLPTLPGARQVTLVNTVPSAMRELLRIGGVPASVRVVNLAGEPLETPLVQEIVRLPGVVKVHDLYGPTETTTYSTWARRRPQGPATIGRPIANTRVYLLDAELQPVPVGVPGELYIAGDGLARGYLDRPELTAERFLPDPFGDEPGARCYRTGDLARYLPDGNLELIGRVDFQVKIRGFRIEPGEIESMLRRHPNVRDTVVVARHDTPGDPRLVAYVVAREQPPPSAAELLDLVSRTLPDSMLPGRFVLLPSLPRTRRGKVDRDALPAPEEARPEVFETFVAPRDETEDALAAIFASVLELERVGVHDDFFGLGGHSLLATRIIARIGTRLGVDIPLRCLFDTPTVAGLAAAVVAAKCDTR